MAATTQIHSNKRSKPIHILALGDSYTIGEGVSETDRWPQQLAMRLRAAHWNVVPPHIIATTGWTTAELQAGIAATPVEPSYDLVFVLIGVNNQYRGLPQNQYQAELEALLKQARQFVAPHFQRVIVISIPDWGVTPFARGRDGAQIAQEIDAFNAIKKRVAHQTGASFVDITGISRQAKNNIALLAPDGLHPSGLMYQLWVEKIWPVVYQALAAKSEGNGT